MDTNQYYMREVEVGYYSSLPQGVWTLIYVNRSSSHHFDSIVAVAKTVKDFDYGYTQFREVWEAFKVGPPSTPSRVASWGELPPLSEWKLGGKWLLPKPGLYRSKDRHNHNLTLVPIDSLTVKDAHEQIYHVRKNYRISKVKFELF